MRTVIIAAITTLLLDPTASPAQQRGSFEQWFTDETMRIDYFHTGDATSEVVALDQVYVRGTWAGSLSNLIDPFDNGRYFFRIHDAATGTLLFSRGFNSYFGEYQTTDPAAAGIPRTYHESALFPCPKEPILFTLEVRQRDNSFHDIFSQMIEPGGVDIIREPPADRVKTIVLLKSGDPHECVDIAFMAEGYAEHEQARAVADLEGWIEVMFSEEPYRSNREHFNLYLVFRASAESGVDEPTRGFWRRTALNSGFNALGLPRYLLTEDNRILRDIAGNVPCDAIVIAVNSDRYGGGGIYNLYAISTVGNELSGHVFLHEFGHSFAGLADEYYTSTVAYNEFYPTGIEPAEPNLTALLDPDRLKWRHLLAPGILLPTPWEKEEYEGIPARQARLRQEAHSTMTRMQQEGASVEAISREADVFEQAIEDLSLRREEILTGLPGGGVVGAYEGAGYSSSGLYRPMRDCLMFRNSAEHRTLCIVCREAVLNMIRYYRGLPPRGGNNSDGLISGRTSR